MTSRDITMDLIFLERKLLVYKMIKRKKTPIFIKLRVDFENFKDANPKKWYFQRVNELKKMIEAATMDEPY